MEQGSNEPSDAPSPGLFKAIALLVVLILVTYFGSGMIIKAQKKPKDKAEGSPTSVADTRGPGAVDGSVSVTTPTVVGEDYETCPVCKVSIKPDDAEYKHTLSATGKVYYFDREKCYLRFLENPGRYVRRRVRIRVTVKPSETETKTTQTPTADSSPGVKIEDVPLDTPPPRRRTPHYTPRTYAPTPLPTRRTPYNPPPATPLPDYTPPGASDPPPATPVPDSKKSPGVDLDDFEIPSGATPMPENKSSGSVRPPKKKIKIESIHLTPMRPPPGSKPHTY